MVRYMNGLHSLKTPVETGTSPEVQSFLTVLWILTRFSTFVKHIFLLYTTGIMQENVREPHCN